MSDTRTYPIEPRPAPRALRSGKRAFHPHWYTNYKMDIHLAGVKVESGDHVIFVISMPRSWSKKKRAELDGQPHMQMGDLDNFIKGILDSIYENDAHIWDLRASKVWGVEGKIIVRKPE